ncbi:MAG: FecR domain-containing protein [Acidobacteria bacterium]|nr:FecR domain-containing protein [Acidobacteriota bacterium]
MKYLSLLVVAFVAMTSVATAQRVNNPTSVSDRYIISAKAGGVNLVEGQVEVLRRDGRKHILVKGDSIEVGDEVLTGATGRAEILLNPGSYARIGADSSFSFKTTSLDDLQLVVDRGSVVFEVFASNDFKVVVETPETKFLLADSGVYRVNSESDNSTIAVLRGRAEIIGTVDGKVKKGREASIDDGQVAVSKFKKSERDELDEWSKDRAKLLARANSRLDRRALYDPLMSSFGSGIWSVHRSLGVWAYNSAIGGYCFVPFGYGWGSPYGYWFGTDIWGFGVPRCVYYGSCSGYPTGGQSGGTPTTNQPTTPTTTTPQRRAPVPPFQRMQRQEGRIPVETTIDRGPVFRPSTPVVVSSPGERRGPVAPPLGGGSSKGRDN